jgi:transposase
MTPASPSSEAVLDPAFVAAFRAGTVSEAELDANLPRDRGAILFVMLQLSAAIGGPPPTAATATGPHTPSGAIPPYEKPGRDPRKRSKKKGGKPGHEGASREKPVEIDKRVTHELPACPDCGGALKRTGRKRTRIIEDLPAASGSEVTEHTIPRGWCPCCQKQVEPKVPDALPGCTLGHRTVALSAWLHYGLGTTTSQILAVFNHHLRMKLSDGGLSQMWHRLATVLTPWADAIGERCLKAVVLHADETGWRTNGETWWLWCFTTPDDTCYRLHPSRGHEALDEFFKVQFDGILVTDFWKAYDKVAKRQQKCWPHLLRDLKAVEDKGEADDDWPDFAGKLRRIYADAIRLDLARDGIDPEAFSRRRDKLHGRMGALAHDARRNPHARRLAKRLDAYGEPLLTFVDHPDVPPSNNHAEREVRPAVLMRKVSQGSRTPAGAATRATLMTVFRTLHRRGLDPLRTGEAALRAFLETGTLPALPGKMSSGG